MTQKRKTSFYETKVLRVLKEKTEKQSNSWTVYFSIDRQLISEDDTFL